MLYAVVPSTAPPEIDVDLPLRRFDRGSVGVLYEERDAVPTPERSDLLSFGEALQTLASTGPVLPVRFGTVLPGLAELTELVQAREPEWRERLGVVEGHVEVLVHARAGAEEKPAPPRAPASGTEYILGRAAVLRRDAALLESLTSALRPLASELRVLPGREELRVACLVTASGVAVLRTALEEWQEGGAGRVATSTGPWPPFSFTTEDDAS